MLSINMSDVINVLGSMRSQLIAIGVILLAGILVLILAGKIQKPKRGMVRGFASIAMVLGLRKQYHDGTDEYDA